MQPIDIEQEKKEILNKYKSLLRVCADTTSKEDKKEIRKAFNLAVEADNEGGTKLPVSPKPVIGSPAACCACHLLISGLSRLGCIFLKCIGSCPIADRAASLLDNPTKADIGIRFPPLCLQI
jgi:hypothetical protein